MTDRLDHVRVARRFQRSVRVDTDLNNPDALAGFVCPPSAAAMLETMAEHVSQTGQTAFTWTGPYGAGKSSLAVALASALAISGQHESRPSVADSAMRALTHALPLGERGWRVLPVVGRRGRPAEVIGEALVRSRMVRRRRADGWSDSDALNTLLEISQRMPRGRGGLLVLIDEMGKFLESAAQEGTDIYFFQELAEMASRSNRRLVVIGILHQAFEEYAHRLSREMRDEWAKVQGRFVDLTVAVGGDEQLTILSHAIEGGDPPSSHQTLASQVAALSARPKVTEALLGCWPLHPLVACLLGPISRRRFGQNQRSVFGFLNSAEPMGFQEFLKEAEEGDLYTPDLLWSYMRFNLEPSILASPDGHRWALALDAINRCEATGGSDLALRLLKTIALVDLFKERTGLTACPDLLRTVAGDTDADAFDQGLSDLRRLSLVVYRRFNDSYSIFAGSDFDIEQAIDEAHGAVGELSHGRLAELADLQPIIAKRHYHETGALRWCSLAVAQPGDLLEAIRANRGQGGATGTLLLTLPSQGDSPSTIEDQVIAALGECREHECAIGVPSRGAWNVAALAMELWALEHVRDNTPMLQGDQVARLEVEGRITALREQIESELQRSLHDAHWRTPTRDIGHLDYSRLNILASDLADDRFPNSPRIQNELLNRSKPSSNAVAAQNALLSRMALNEGEERLGIVGFPAEGGLLASLLENTGLYELSPQGWRFKAPDDGALHNLAPAWSMAEQLLSRDPERAIPVSEIWDEWREPPFGIKDGLMPILTAAFLLSNHNRLALYRDGAFQSQLSDLDLHVMARNPSDVQLRWMVLSESDRRLLSDLADVVRDLDQEANLADLQPLDVARGLIRIHDRLPHWTRRTQRLSIDARSVRQMFKRAHDPNQLLFDDIPSAFAAPRSPSYEHGASLAAKRVSAGLRELEQVYSAMLRRIEETLLTELRVSSKDESSLAELRARAENVLGLGADHRQEAFAVRLAGFHGHDGEVEGLISLAVSKPPSAWTDADIDGATLSLAEMAQQFIRREAFAHVQGRADKRHAIAVVVGLNGKVRPLHREIDISELDRPEVESLVARIERSLADYGEPSDDVVLAAMAELSARRIETH